MPRIQPRLVPVGKKGIFYMSSRAACRAWVELCIGAGGSKLKQFIWLNAHLRQGGALSKLVKAMFGCLRHGVLIKRSDLPENAPIIPVTRGGNMYPQSKTIWMKANYGQLTGNGIALRVRFGNSITQAQLQILEEYDFDASHLAGMPGDAIYLDVNPLNFILESSKANHSRKACHHTYAAAVTGYTAAKNAGDEERMAKCLEVNYGN